jgi:cytochrome c-type biogenesis protein CcmH/NrfF
LIRKESIAQEPAKETNWILLAAVLVGGVLLGAIVMYVSRDESQPALASAAAAFDPKLHGPALATAFPEVYQVASEFICPCGTCTDGLEVCDCEMVKGASEVRQFIYDNLNAGHRPPHVTQMVEAKYGYRKSGRPPITFENLPAPTLPTNQK